MNHDDGVSYYHDHDEVASIFDLKDYLDFMTTTSRTTTCNKRIEYIIVCASEQLEYSRCADEDDIIVLRTMRLGSVQESLLSNRVSTASTATSLDRSCGCVKLVIPVSCPST